MNCLKYGIAFLVAVLLFEISGCASTYQLRLNSDPPGAVLYQGNTRFGYMPITLPFQVPEEAQRQGYFLFSGFQARWASGASANITPLRFDLNQGLNQQISFMRPENFPGYDIDARFALELEKLDVMHQQTAIQRRQAIVQAIEANQKIIDSQKRCISQRVGNIIQTTCY